MPITYNITFNRIIQKWGKGLEMPCPKYEIGKNTFGGLLIFAMDALISLRLFIFFF